MTREEAHVINEGDEVVPLPTQRAGAADVTDAVPLRGVVESRETQGVGSALCQVGARR